MNKNKVGLVLGLFIGLWHVAWSVLIAFGLAQPLLDFIYKIHSLNVPVTVMPFDLGHSVGLIIITFLVGYLVGYVFATIWNRVHK